MDHLVFIFNKEVQMLYNYLWPEADKFDLHFGPYHGVQNLEKLIEYRNGSKVNADWVYSPKEGPFRVLGAERISKIVNEQSNVDAILRLNEAITNLFRSWYEQIRDCMKQKQNPLPMLPVEEKNYVNLSSVYDAKGKTLLLNCFDLILNGKAELSAIDELVALGVDVNSEVSFSNDFQRVTSSPLAYLWACMNTDDDKVIKTIKQILARLISLGIDVNKTYGLSGDNFVTALRPAVVPPFIEMLPWFVANKGDIHFKDVHGNTLLQLFLYLPGLSPPTFTRPSAWLIENGVDVTAANNNGEHAIHLLCRYAYNEEKNNALLSAILTKAPQEVDVRDSEGHTPLYWSVRTGKLNFVESIISHWTKDKNSSDAVELLHAFADFIDLDSRTLSWQGNSQVLSKEEIERKLEKNYMPLIQVLLPFIGETNGGLRKFLITPEEGSKSTILAHMAKICPWIVDSLLAHNFILPEDLNLTNGQGETIAAIGKKTINSFLLLIACSNVDKKSVLELLKDDVSLDIMTNDKQSLLKMTINGCISSQDDKWSTGIKIFVELLKKGVNPNCADDKGDTPLHSAINTRSFYANPFILELINFGAETRKANNKGETARDLIRQLTNWQIAKDAILGAP